MAFDLTSIPTNATVTDVTLAMFNSSPSVAAVNVSLRKVSRDWAEGNSNAGSPGGSGTQAQPADATWLHNFFSGSSWATVGGRLLDPQQRHDGNQRQQSLLHVDPAAG